MARFKLFGPLVRVPSVVLNLIQEGLLDQRGTGSTNSMGNGLLADGTTWNQRRVHHSMDFAGTFLPVRVDHTIDWRDRVIDVVMWFDPDHDIRPGQSGDLHRAEVQVETSYYTGVGGKYFLLSPLVALYIDTGGGELMLLKGNGYLHVRVSSGLQIKERS